MRKEDIMGRWFIIAWEQRYDDGRVTYPMGEHPRGFIHYTEDHMFCVITPEKRSAFTTGGQWDAADTDKARAYDTYLTYTGPYEIQDDMVCHYVSHSLYPGWEGGVQRRTARLSEGRLYLTARLEEGTAAARTASLIWARTPSTQHE